jgi:hypothetical protein
MTDQPTIREFPACDPRIEDGPVQFGDDWPGLFLRGDTAAHYASHLGEFLSTNPPADPIVLGMLRGLLSDLESCNLVSRREKSPPEKT